MVWSKFFIISCLLLVATTVAADLAYAPQQGSNDFIQYWSAYQLLLQGQNFYDPSQLLLVQKPLHPWLVEPMRMWNPPWILFVMSPVLLLPFKVSVSAWVFCNLILLLLSAQLLWLSAKGKGVASPLVFFLALTFMPSWEVINLGQVSILLTFLVSLVIYGLVTKRHTLAGISLALLSIKPHLFIPLGIFVLFRMLREKNYRFFLGLISCSLVLVAATVLFAPTAISSWLVALSTPPLQWRVASLVGVLRTIEYLYFANSGEWLIWFVPSVGVVIALLFSFRGKAGAWLTDLPLILFVSVITAPYGWFFDFAVLLPLQLLTLIFCLQVKATPKQQALALFLALLPNLLVLLQRQLGAQHQIEYAWFPVGVLLSYYLSKIVSRKIISRRNIAANH